MKTHSQIYAIIITIITCWVVGQPIRAQALLFNDLYETENTFSISNQLSINDQLKTQQNPLWRQQNKKRQTRDNLINQLDTVIIYGVSVPTQRQTHTYSPEGNRIYTIIEHLNNNVWELNKQENATFDDENNKLTSVIEHFENGGWLNYKKTTRTYTSNHNMLTETIENWIDNAWLNNSRSTFIYNVAGNPVSLLKENWNIDEWTNYAYDLYTYDENDNITATSTERWLNGSWKNSNRNSYTYDANGNRLTGISESWVSDNWQNVYKDIYAYNMANNPSNYAGQIWDASTSLWMMDILFNYEYNDLDYLTSSEQKLWINGGWENVDRSEYTYTTYGSLESTLLEVWNANAFENKSLTQSNYDEYGNAFNVYYYNWSGGSWVLNVDGELPMTYNFNSKEERFIGSYLYAHYTSLPVGQSEVAMYNKANLHCQPNPSNGETTLIINIPNETMTTISMYSITGNKIKTLVKRPLNKGIHQLLLPTNEYHPGLYFLLMETIENNITYKLIIN